MDIHLWDTYNSEKISVDISKELKDKISLLIPNKQEFARKIKITPARLYDYFVYQKTPIPLNILMKILKLLKISQHRIEHRIIMYKQLYVPCYNSVENPKLPLEITPYFTSIVANLYFDGSVPKDGKGTYYNQKNEEIMNNFVKRLEKVFGNVQHTINEDHRGVLTCRVPRIIGEICKSVYNVDSFGTFDSKISDKIFSLPLEHKIAFVLTAIIDEGSITHDGRTFFGVSNKILCDGVKLLCKQIGLETTEVKQKLNSNHYYFYIKSKEKLMELINLFNKKYPFISLNYKEKRLRYYFEIKKYPGLRTKKGADERRDKIISSLKEGSKSGNQLTEELLIPPRVVRRHLKYLINANKISRIKISNQFIFSLK